MNNKKVIFLSFLVAFIGMLITTGTFAFFNWQSNNNKGLSFNVASNLKNYIEYDNGDSTFVGNFQVSNSFTDGIHSTISIKKKQEAASISMVATINMDINAIGPNMAKSSALKWVVTSGNSSSVGPILSQGNFIGSKSGDTLMLLPNIEVTTSVKEYTIWIWLDINEHPSDALSGETLDTAVWTQIEQLAGMEEIYEITKISANYQRISATVINNKNVIMKYAITTSNNTPDSWTDIDTNLQNNIYNLEYNTSATGTYYIWFMDSASSITSSSISVTNIDTTAPNCTFDSFNPTQIANNENSQIILTCIDAESIIENHNLTKDNLITSSSVVNVTNVRKEQVANGCKYTITVTGTETNGSANITLPANIIRNSMHLGNEITTSGSITVRNIIDLSSASITLNPTSFTYDGTAKEPTITVIVDGDTLTRNTDYSASFTNNINVGTATVTITGINDYEGSASTTFTITKGTCTAPTNVLISSTGIVTWTDFSGADSYEVSIDNTNYTAASSGVDYNSMLTATTGNKTIYIRSLCNSNNYNTPSTAASTSVSVYSVTLTKGTGIATVTGASNYISGATVSIDATSINGYTFSNWTSGSTQITTTKAYSATITSNWNYIANATVNNYTVTANANGGSIVSTTGWTGTGSSATKSVTYNSTYGTLPSASMAGYVFEGWNGKNLFSGLTKGRGIDHTTGVEHSSTIQAISDYILVDFDTNSNYYISGLATNLSNYVAAYNENKEFLGRMAACNSTINPCTKRAIKANSFSVSTTSATGNVKYIRIHQYKTASDTGTIDDVDNLNIQLEIGSVDTTYEPYYINSNTIVTIPSNHTINAIWSLGSASYTVNHYIRDMGANTYTLNSTDNLSGTTLSTVTLASLTKTIAGFTYDGGYTTGNTTRPTSGDVTTTTILADGSRVINLYYRRNYLYIQYNINGGSLASAHGTAYGVSDSLVTYTGNTVSTNFLRGVYGGKVGSINTTTLAASSGLHDYNNASYINIEKDGYIAKSNAEWNTNASGTGSSYSQSTTTYDAIAMASACGADLSAGDAVITLYVNWVDGVPPTITTDLKSVTYASDFSQWSLSGGATIDSNGYLNINASGNNAYSPYFETKGLTWNPIFEYIIPDFESNASSSPMEGFYYYNETGATVSSSGYRQARAMTTTKENQWLNSTKENLAATTAYYTRDRFYWSASYVKVPYKIRNYRMLLNGDISSQGKLIYITATDTLSGVSQIKWLSGTKTISDFASSGTVVTNGYVEFTTASTYTIYAVDNVGNGTVKVITISNIDRTNPTASISGGTTAKQTSQSFNLSCSDNINVSAYYWGTTNPNGSTLFTVLSSATASWSGTASVSTATTYYLGCKDTAGNISSSSVVVRSYTVHNMLLTLSGTKNTYTTANYALVGAASTYYIKTGTGVTGTSICTQPTGATAMSGYKSGAPSTTNASPLTAASTATTVSSNLTIGCWYNRNVYTMTVKSGTGGKVTAQTVGFGASVVVNSGSSGTLDVRYGDTVNATASANAGYSFSSWSGYITGSTNSNTGAAITANASITGTFTANNYTVNYNQNLFNSYNHNMSGANVKYDKENQYITLNGDLSTTAAGYYTLGDLINVPVALNDTYQITIKYVSGSFTTTASNNRFYLRLYNGSTSLGATNGTSQRLIALSNSVDTSATLAISSSSMAAANRFVYAIYQTAGTTTFDNYTIQVLITKVDSKTVTFNSTYGTLPTPTKGGYTFNNWYTEVSGGTVVNSSTTVTTASNHTIHANWTPKTYSVTINPNGGKIQGSSSTYTVSQKYNSQIVLPKPVREGYTFDGWTMTAGTGLLTKYGEGQFNDDGFVSSNNGMTIYNNDNNGLVTHTKIATTSDNPMKNSSYIIQITTSGSVKPGLGGFVQSTTSRADAIFYHVIVAKIPVGYTLQYNQNSTGTGRKIEWLTSNKGTGSYETYIYKHTCGSSGTFSTFGHVYISGSAATSSNPVTWYVAYANMFDYTSNPTIEDGNVFTYGPSNLGLSSVTLTAKWVSHLEETINYGVNDNFLSTTIKRNQIKSVTFTNSISGHTINNTNCWDVSEFKDGTILAWSTGPDNNGLYEITIGRNGVVEANPNSARLFFNLTNVTNINMESNLNTLNVINMQSMFNNVSNLTTLDVSNLNTTKVTSMHAMFNNATNLTSLAVSNWNTSNVTNMSSIFNNATNLTTLAVGHWNMSNVTNMSRMFMNAKRLYKLGVDNWNTSNVTDMSSMFFNVYNLTTLNLGSWITRNVTNMYAMFNNASNLTTLNVRKWNTSNVINMRSLFNSANNLTNLDVSNWNTSNVTDMSRMFLKVNGENLTTLDVSNWNTAKVTDMHWMFSSAANLRTLNVSNWNTSNVTNMYAMFHNANNLTTLNVSNWNTSKVTDMSNMFMNTKKIHTLNVSNWNTSNVTNMYAMFHNARSLTTLNVSNWNTANVTDMSFMFLNARSLTTLNLSNWNTSKVTDISSAFYNAISLTTLDVSNFDTSNVIDMGYMFGGAYNLTTLDVSNWNTAKVTNMTQMFCDTNNLTTLNVSKWNTSNVVYTDYMFYNAYNLTTLNVSNFNTSNVTNMHSMFRNANSLTTLNVSNWNTSNVTNMVSMFSNANSLTTLNVSNWNTSNVTNMSNMFYNANNLTTLNVSNWNTSKVTNMSNMFANVDNLTTIYAGSGWSTANVTVSANMFYGASNLRGGSGTTYSASYVDKTYAKIDGGTSSPGYFTAAGAKGASTSLSPKSLSKASINTSNISNTIDECNNNCGTSCLESSSGYVCPSYSCDSGILSGTECYNIK